ncbi:MAG: DUF6584 family protein [Planctomycetota bacterium]
MSKETTLKKVNYDVSQGNLGKACNRLQGLIMFDPDDLSLRVKIAEIYYQAKFLALAGKYWYLEENKTEIMKTACAEFEKYRGYSPLAILWDLKFRGNIDKLPKYAKEKLLALQKECKGGYKFYPKISAGKRKKWKESFKDKLFKVGCLAIVILLVILIGIGVFTVFKWMG